MRVFKCQCGNMVELLQEGTCPIMCCGKPMTELTANTTDAATEKHVPVVAVDGNKVTVTVGEVEHPMLDAHYIQWIFVETKNGVLRKNLKPGEAPKAEFVLAEGDEVVAVYEYCNLHGLWKK